ncbi:MEDS domain-containing protein [Halobellus salinisoli]|uniref:MEDS domain-containing protein n=1 Tax=Halobellus salinisoli TaxID=3108500 RepID=UPI00300B82FC
MSTHHPPSHEHSVLIHEAEAEVVDGVISFFREGLESDKQCIYVGGEERHQSITEGLVEGGIDVITRIGSGDLLFRLPDHIYLENSEFDSVRTVDLLEELIDTALSEGYNGVCIAGETSWITDSDVDLDEWREYERRMNRVFRERPAMGLCLYNRSRFSADLLSDTLCSHPKVAEGSDAIENIYYRSPPELSAVAASADDLDQKLWALSQHQETQRSLSEREQYLESLNRTIQQANHPGKDEPLKLPFDTIRNSLDASIASIWVYDEETGSLELVEKKQFDQTVDIEEIEPVLHDQIWGAFTDRSKQTFDETIAESTESDTNRLNGALLPLGNHGVFLVANNEEWNLSEPDWHLLETVAGIAEATLDRQEYESAIERKNSELERQNERLRRVERINEVFQRLSDVLISASTRREILTAACDDLTTIEDVAFAWVGGFDTATEQLENIHIAGDPDGYFDAIASEWEATETEPSWAAAMTRDSQSVQNVRSPTPMQDWRKEALQRGVRSVISLPLLYDEELHGVLTVYLRDARVLDEEVRGVFERLSGLVARTINGIERKRALVGDRVTEVKLRLHSDEHAAIQLVSELDCQFVLEGVVPADDESFHVFAGIDTPPEQLLDFVETAPVVETATVVTERESDYLYECAVTGDCFLEFLLEHNVVPKTLVANNESAHTVLDLPGEKSVSEFMHAFRRRYPEVELVSKNQRERTVRTPAGFRADIQQSLTQRQLETLKTAYFGGYFEWPRDTSTEELAEMLGVTHPTISRHLREAHRRVLTEIFGDK